MLFYNICINNIATVLSLWNVTEHTFKNVSLPITTGRDKSPANFGVTVRDFCIFLSVDIASWEN